MQLQVASPPSMAPSDSQPMVESKEFDVGAALNALIARSGRAKNEFAEYMGVSEQAVQKWINQGTIARGHIRKICLFLGCSADELLGIVPIGASKASLLSQSQPVRIDLEMLKSAIISVEKALRGMNIEFNTYSAATVLAGAYAERAAMPRDPTKAQYRALDTMVAAKLQKDIEDGSGQRRLVETGKRVVEVHAATKKKAGNRK